MVDSKPVKRCVCANVPFSVLRDAGITSLDEARIRFGCGAGCATCVPYIETMLKTGETEFAVIWPPVKRL